jgi:hypothetical protein
MQVGSALLGITIPAVIYWRPPVANYVDSVQSGKLLFLAGNIALSNVSGLPIRLPLPITLDPFFDHLAFVTHGHDRCARQMRRHQFQLFTGSHGVAYADNVAATFRGGLAMLARCGG